MDKAEKIKQLKKKITFIQKMLDLLRKILGLRTRLEKMKTELMVREICEEEKMSEAETDVLVAVIWCESGMNPKAINRNVNGTIDYGLCQFNDYWYGNVITPEEALYEPGKAVEIMCKMFKKGRANDWICYRNAGYIKFLKVVK